MNDESRKALPAHRSSFRIHRSSLVSPISSGGNFGGLRLSRACSDPGGAPGVSGSVSPRTCLRHGFWLGYAVVERLCRTVIGLSNGAVRQQHWPSCQLPDSLVEYVVNVGRVGSGGVYQRTPVFTTNFHKPKIAARTVHLHLRCTPVHVQVSRPLRCRAQTRSLISVRPHYSTQGSRYARAG